jgi:hypothetical protein
MLDQTPGYDENLNKSIKFGEMLLVIIRERNRIDQIIEYPDSLRSVANESVLGFISQFINFVELYEEQLDADPSLSINQLPRKTSEGLGDLIIFMRNKIIQYIQKYLSDKIDADKIEAQILKMEIYIADKN